MAQFKLTRFRYVWKGPWQAATEYNRDDTVSYGAKTFVCIRAHTSDENFYTDYYYFAPGETVPSPAWVQMSEGYKFRGDWAASTRYNLGDVVKYGGSLYLTTEAHDSDSTFAANADKWQLYAALVNWRNNWNTNTRYGANDLVKYNGILYRCITEHTSANSAISGLVQDQDKWAVYFEHIQYVGEWNNPSLIYIKKNDLVKYGGSILRAIADHPKGSDIENQFFEVELYGNLFAGVWDNTTYYAVGDVVRHGGYIYRANANNINSSPGNAIYQTDGSSITLVEGSPSPDWTIIFKAINVRGDWSSSTTYKTGDLVRRGGMLYLALLDTTSDGSTLDYLDASNWDIVVPGDNWRGSWALNLTFSYGDLSTFAGSLWRCIVQHVSSNQNYPGDNGSGFVYWELVLLAGSETTTRILGDLITYGLVRDLTGSDTSTIGESRVPVGGEAQYLTVAASGGPGAAPVYGGGLEYRDKAFNARTFYVGPAGVDDITDPERGKSDGKPWATINFACRMIEDEEYEGPSEIRVQPGVYEEILPIVIPARTAVKGEEVRSVTVKPKGANSVLSGDLTYSITALNRIQGIVDDLFVGNIIPKSTGNTLTQDTTYLSDQFTSEYVQTMIARIKDYLNYNILGTGSPVTPTGSNTADTSTLVVNGIRNLEANKNFIAEEAVAYVRQLFPNYNFDTEQCKRDVRAYVDAFKYDLKYTGTYRSIRAAEQYKNALQGSAGQNMFLVRDTTGVRNMTLEGLTGTLPDLIPTDFDDQGPAEDARPTGGAYVSLDPGWGPDDQKVWIINRSCYVQNVTTFGYAAIGQKIDGALHNGGNKSIVSNDFTQIISDGIGAWVTNGGLAELVSVFTYYSHIGYLAEAGGKIRAANGNNSYGNYGALSTGVSSSEIPRTGKVNNRTEQAEVRSVLAGEISDDILIFEYVNAGLNYTNAIHSISGSGVQAQTVQEEFRDDAVFETRLIDADGSTTPGGLNYKFEGNNAQTGNLTSITLATNDPADTEDEYLGLRIIIISGTGTGQYGIINSFNVSSKLATIIKESDGTPGWDHVIPGWPLTELLTTSTTYRIEPRPIWPAPSYSAETRGLPITATISNMIYGETTEFYEDIAGTEGEGTVVTDDGLTPVTATFDVEKNGRNYVVTINNPGAGYADEQTITLSGEDLGGLSPENDIVITVKSITNDSTNSIVSFVYEGEGSTGRFIATPAAGRDVLYSGDGGQNWQGSLLPDDGDWRSLAAGHNRFLTVKYNSNQSAISPDGVNWTLSTITGGARFWSAAVFGERPNNSGEGIFVVVSENLNACAISRDYGETWDTSFTLPEFGDSTLNQYVDIAYGSGKFVAIANSGNIAAVGTYDWENETMTWEGVIMDVVADSSAKDWISVAYGNNRFVAISSTGDIAYSFDGSLWYPGTMPTQDGSTQHTWTRIRYGQGVFCAVGNTGGLDVAGDPTLGPSTFLVTSNDGILWDSRSLEDEKNWSSLAFGNPRLQQGDSTRAKNTGVWIVAGSDADTSINRFFTGARARGRVVIQGSGILEMKMWEPGSGYIDTTPTVTIVDPNNTTDAAFECRIGDGVLAQPSWLNRGFGYRSSTTSVTVQGDGYADKIPVGKFVTLSDLSITPKVGAQLEFQNDPIVYSVSEVLEDYEENFLITARFRINPPIERFLNLAHDTPVTIREAFSQVRMTGHDFLDIGTGNFLQTNYPEIYSTGNFRVSPENEVVEKNNGRVFYVSTDQIGNFRVGELFAVEQATGIVTIAAEFFDFGGLTELRLGGVRLGGSGVLIREFSTDPLFLEDSNNIIPTQRAIKSYLQARLTIGGSELTTASFIAGTVRFGPDQINNSANLENQFPKIADFTAGAEISGRWVADILMHKSFNDDPGVIS